MRKLLSYAFIAFMLVSQIGHAAEVENINENIRRLGFDRFYTDLKRDRNTEKVKVAIFDFGFSGYKNELGYTIPKSTELKVRPGDTYKTRGESNIHGLAMAQIVTQYTTDNYTHWRLAPKIYLYKSDGYTNFQWAIDDAIKNGVDIILHSSVLEYGSNYDGRGFYNAVVNKATNAGIIWVNAAGNFGLTTFNSEVLVGRNNWVELGHLNKDSHLDKNALPIVCAPPEKSKEKTCQVRIVLSWDDFKDQPYLGTKKDLDLYVYDRNFESSVSSQLSQVSEDDPRVTLPGITLYPREIVETRINKGVSYIKVKAKTDNFASTDRLRITADGDNIQFPDRDENESLLNPADNPNVITVGEDSARSSVSISLHKPELVAPSLVKGDDGREYQGSSNAAAVVAAGIALMKKINPDLNRDAVLDLITGTTGKNFIRPYPQMMSPMGSYVPVNNVPSELNANLIQSQRHVDQVAIPIDVLGFKPLSNNGCFPLADLKAVDPCVVGNFIVKSRSLLVQTTAGLKIATTFDPTLLLSDDERNYGYGSSDRDRQNLNDVVAIYPTDDYRFRRTPRGAPLPQGAIEIFRMPLDQLACKIPDWQFLVTELNEARRRVYEANATGVYNQFMPQSCNVNVMVRENYPVSDWRMYPSLQQVPYGAPIGPTPMPIEPPYSYPYPSNHQPGDQFHLPNPNDLKDNH